MAQSSCPIPILERRDLCRQGLNRRMSYGRQAVLGSAPTTRLIPMVLILAWFLAATAFDEPATPPDTWEPGVSGSSARFRGVSVVNDRVAWASGTDGSFTRTSDGGADLVRSGRRVRRARLPRRRGDRRPHRPLARVWTGRGVSDLSDDGRRRGPGRSGSRIPTRTASSTHSPSSTLNTAWRSAIPWRAGSGSSAPRTRASPGGSSIRPGCRPLGPGRERSPRAGPVS